LCVDCHGQSILRGQHDPNRPQLSKGFGEHEGANERAGLADFGRAILVSKSCEQARGRDAIVAKRLGAQL
jgi:hypothetical protein